MPNLDIFGGKPLSAYHNNGVARRSTTTAASSNFIKEFRTGSKESMIAAFNILNTQGLERSALLSTLSSAWNKVVYNLFKAKVVKKEGANGKKGTFTLTKRFVTRKGVRKDLNTVEYFRARHPKLFKIYIESFNQYLNMSPAQGGVVVKYSPENPGQLIDNKFEIQHYKKFNRYSLPQMQNILRFLKDAHYDSVRDLAIAATSGNSGLSKNRAQSGGLYAPIGNTNYSVMTLYAMFKKLAKTNPGHPAYGTLSRAFSGVPVVSPIKIKGRGMGVAEKEAERKRHHNEKVVFKRALSSMVGKLDNVASEVSRAMDTASSNRNTALSHKKEATAQRFAQMVSQLGVNTVYQKGVFNSLNPEDRKFANGVVLSVRKRFNPEGKTLGSISQDVNTNALKVRGTRARDAVRTIKATRRGVPAQGGSLSSSRLSSMSSSSLSSSRDDFSRDDSEFSFY